MPWVECERCGHVWETNAKRPQCSVCKGVVVSPVPEPEDEGVDTVDGAPTADFDGAVDEPINTPTPQSTANQQQSTGAINGVLIALGIVLLLGAVGYKLLFSKKNHKTAPNQQPINTTANRQLTPW